MLWKKIRLWRSSKPSESGPVAAATESATNEPDTPKPDRYFNRELSDLAFIDRILQESTNPRNPLLERLRFVAISASVLDQFYTVRVAGLMRRLNRGDNSNSFDGLSTRQQLTAVNAKANLLMEAQQDSWRHIRDELASREINLLAPTELEQPAFEYLEQHFQRNILPALSPFVIDREHPFPYIPSGGLCVIAEGKQSFGRTTHLLIPIPNSLPRFIILPSEGIQIATIESAVIHFIDEFLPGSRVTSCGTFQILRDNELALEDRFDDLMKMVETSIRQREKADVIRLKFSEEMSEQAIIFVAESLGVLKRSDIESLQQRNQPIAAADQIVIGALIGLSDVMSLIQNDLAPEFPQMVYPRHEPILPERVAQPDTDMFEVISDRDLLLHWPYDDFEILVQFIQQAARDPDVTAIKQTLYRTGEDSPVVAALIDAAERGKAVTAVIELEARDDESANVRFAKHLEAVGAQIVYGIIDLKVHCKMTLVVRREGSESTIYTHFGTGNYHPGNARSYTDLSLLTCNATLGREANQVFNYLTSGTLTDCANLVVSPGNLRDELMALIDIEIENRRNGLPGAIWAKINSLEDTRIIDKLYEASAAGVSVDLTVRRHCSLRPGVPGLSENIVVRSIVGRFLEHTRAYCFANGHELPHPGAKVFLSSADWMRRNFDERVEIAVPVTDPVIHKQILEQVLMTNRSDSAQSWFLDEHGVYTRASGEFSAQEWFLGHRGLSGQQQ